jgi:hypothetical protein
MNLKQDKEPLSWLTILVISYFLFSFVCMSGRNIAIITCLLCLVLVCICPRIRKSYIIMLLLLFVCLCLTFTPLDITVRRNKVYQVKILPIIVTHGVYKHIREKEEQGQSIDKDFVVYHLSGGITLTLPQYALVIFIP